MVLVLDSLWRDRNSLVFSNISILGDGINHQIAGQAQFIAHNMQHSLTNMLGRTTRVADISWKPPPAGWFKINVDGSHVSKPDSIACGGLARDCHGGFLQGFYCKVGFCNAIWA